MGICCSISRQALILSRRHTQHSGSSPALIVSALQTEHLVAFLIRSAETARFASSRSSGGTGISSAPLTVGARLSADGTFGFGFMQSPYPSPLWQKLQHPT